MFMNCTSILLVTAALFFAAGCDKAGSGPTSLSEQERTALEKEWAISLPSDITLLLSDDGGGRDAHWQYYRWLVYSKSSIDLSPDKVPSPSGHIPNNDATDKAKWFQSLAPKTDFGTPTTASTLTWGTGSFEFRGNLLKTSNGNYLYVQRFAKNMISASAPK